jgi:Fe-S oxidoreductase
LSKTVIFTPLLLAAFLFFFRSVYRRLSLVSLGKPSMSFRGIRAGLREMFLNAFLQKRVLRKAFGVNHLVIFWSFVALVLVNVEFMINGVFPSFSLALLPNTVYLPIRAVSDITAALTLVAVVLALVRRSFFPPYPEARSLEGYTIILTVGIHMCAYLGLAATEIALGREHAAGVMPVSRFVASLFPTADTAGSCAHCAVGLWGAFFWWLHAVALLVFITVLIPFTKHIHVITAMTNCFLHKREKPNTQAPEIFADGNVYGAGQVDHFTTHDLFDSFACTRCGRCQIACPAGVTGKPLNPRRVVEDIRINLLCNGPLLKRGETPRLPLIGDGGKGSVPVEAIWDCTTCGACMEACPVFIEHVPKLVGMRRHLVEMEASIPEELLNLFENMEARSNPWGIAPSERAKWCVTLGEKTFSPDSCDYLFYVGCASAFDARQKQVTVALTTILDAAGISWGILGRDEKCCGDSLRRLGNEYVFDRMARENVALFRERGVTKVITQCPHCFSTLANDYRQYGLELEVVHHTQLIMELLTGGKLQPKRRATELGKIIFHDSCYLGRHNGVYDAPRAVLKAVTGNAPAEMGRNRADSFCCGAGGGRMWMEEQVGTRINLNRVEEALRENVDTVCVACPYCMTMFEDGLKDLNAPRTLVRDIAEVVAEGLRQ